MSIDGHVPYEAMVLARIQESPNMFSLDLQLTDPEVSANYSFQPGQFNMLYLHGIGEIPISIVSDPDGPGPANLRHTIRTVGRVSRAMSGLREGDRIGVRGPFGRGWPLDQIAGNDVFIVTGGLGCAPVVSVINYIFSHRELYGHLTILQGVKHSDDLIWRESYEQWDSDPGTDVYLAASIAGQQWPGFTGPVTALFEQVGFAADRTVSMMCGPELMMRASAEILIGRGLAVDRIWLSMERNMQCAVGLCGHCQFGANFICKDGPVFPWCDVAGLLQTKRV